MIYCDTSLIVAALTSEPWIEVARDLLDSRLPLAASHFHATRARRSFRPGDGPVTSAPRGLRVGDALHLAIVIDPGSALASFDRDMRDAALARRIVVHPDG